MEDIVHQQDKAHMQGGGHVTSSPCLLSSSAGGVPAGAAAPSASPAAPPALAISAAPSMPVAPPVPPVLAVRVSRTTPAVSLARSVGLGPGARAAPGGRRESFRSLLQLLLEGLAVSILAKGFRDVAVSNHLRDYGPLKVVGRWAVHHS